MATRSSLRQQVHQTLQWIVFVPIVAIWPFVSAFPIFGILETDRFDLNTFLNCLFALTGFWTVFALAVTASFIMGTQARSDARLSLHNHRGLIGLYVVIWSTLYLIFGIFR
ncbi:MAG: hypothetical protein FGM26_02750 [Beijerinckiaceae bacterium]|nr:hypothetical protein [Beijerinckiaceae bacterium]